MKQAAIIIPTTGNEKVVYAIESALQQTYTNTKVIVVTDGNQSKIRFEYLNLNIPSDKQKNIEIINLPENTGANGQNGHRIYAAMSFLSNADYLLYLDQDCWFDDNHVASCVNLIENNNIDWCYSLRKIYTEDAQYICNDDCESLGFYTHPGFGYQLIDTNCYCIKREIAMMVAPYFVGGWGHDRRYFQILSANFKNFDCTGKYTTNYRLGGDNNLTGEFWQTWNKHTEEAFKDTGMPWRKNSEM